MGNNLISKYARIITGRSQTDRIRCYTKNGSLFFKYAVTLFPCNHKAYISHGGELVLTTICNTCRELHLEYEGFQYDLTTTYRIREVSDMIDEAECVLKYDHYTFRGRNIFYSERAKGIAKERLPRLRKRLEYLKKLHDREQITRKT